jgi:hypothetical protein
VREYALATPREIGSANAQLNFDGLAHKKMRRRARGSRRRRGRDLQRGILAELGKRRRLRAWCAVERSAARR